MSLCECGCGQTTKVLTKDDPPNGLKKGDSRRFMRFHQFRHHGMTGEKNPNWKGGKKVVPGGYIGLRRPDHPRAARDSYVYEHILVAEEKMGGPLLPGEEVHHRNKNKHDNRPENLVVLADKSVHRTLEIKRGSKHLKDTFAENELIECACGCGEWRERFDVKDRARAYIAGHRSRMQAKR